MTRGCGPTDPTAADYNVAIVNYRRLTRSDRALRLMQTNSGAIIFQRLHSRNRSGMIIANLDHRFERRGKKGGVRVDDFYRFVMENPSPQSSLLPQGERRMQRGWGATHRFQPQMPIHAVDFELLTDQIVGVAHDHAICFRIEVDNVTRPQRSARKSFALADREELDAAVFGNEVSIDIINLTAMKFVFAEVRTQKRFVIISRYETNFLAIDLAGDFQAYECAISRICGLVIVPSGVSARRNCG